MAETKGLHELIQRIKCDGVEAGNEEREKILADARAEAEAIVTSARKEAETLLAEAREAINTQREHADSALRMAAHDFISAFKHQLRTRHIRPLIVDHVGALMKDPSFLGKTLSAIFSQYVGGEGSGAEVVVHPDMKNQLTAWIARNLEEGLSKEGLVLREDPQIQGFRFMREDEGFYWDFTLKTVAEELSLLVEPGLRPYLEPIPRNSSVAEVS